MKHSLLFPLAGVLTLWACSVQEVEKDETQLIRDGWHQVSVDASWDAESTRLAVDEITGQFSWQRGDAISLFESGGGLPLPMMLTSGEGTGKGVFTGVLPESALSNIAFFPHNSEHLQTSFFLPDEYQWKESETSMPMIARNMPENGESANLSFKLMGGLFVFTVNGLSTDAKAFRFIAPGKNITGSFPVDVSAENPTLETTEGTDNTVTIRFEEASGSMKFYIPVPVGSYSGLEIQILDEKDAILFQKEYSKTAQVARRDILLVSEITYEPPYEKVTSVPTDWTGDYLIVHEATNTLLSSVAKIISNYCGIALADVVISNNRISAEDYGLYNIRIEKSGTAYSLKLENGTGAGYLGWSSKNTLISSSAVESDFFRWTLSLDDVGNALITNKGDSNRRILYNVSNPRFCCYAESSLGDYVKDLQLYRRTPISGPTVILTTGVASEVSNATATLNATFSGLNPVDVREVGFKWGTSETSLSTTTYDLTTLFDSDSGTISATLSSLASGTTYYYQVTMMVYDKASGSYVEFTGNIKSFRTLSDTSGEGNAGLQWLGCYEMPAIDLKSELSYSGTGKETFGSTYWFNYETTNPMQKVITHTYSYAQRTYRNYTALIDGNMRCPLWTAYPMHAEAYPDNGIGRVGDFNENTSYDPGIDKAWQSSGSTSDYNNGNGYSRGHHCASADRQTNDAANKQTFYYTNQSPQWQNNFNGGVWGTLEQDIRNNLVPSGRDTLYVVVGTLFEDGKTGSSNDGGMVARPSHFYKLLMYCSFDVSGIMTDAKGVAYLFTNEAHAKANYSKFITSISLIEESTGIDFFANVPSEFQSPAEQMNEQLW